jgi:glutathione S-transferase
MFQTIHLLTENTPNGKKVQILLEEMREAYDFCWKTHLLDLDTDEQKKDWFLALNPNGRLSPPRPSTVEYRHVPEQ